MVRKLSNLALMVAEILLQPWLPVDDVEVRQLATTSRGVRSGRSSRPRPHTVLCFPHHRQWTTEYSCKVWCKPCRRRLIPRQHSRHSWRPRQNNETTSSLLFKLHDIVFIVYCYCLMQQAQAPAQDHGGPSIMERFKRMAPPSFKGDSDPLLAESWMREIEKIFRAIRCTEDDKVTLATYMLQVCVI